QQQASAVWAEVQAGNPGVTFSSDYAVGFADGFTDFLGAGGNAAVPTLPPRRYWNGRYQNPAGHQAIQDWFAGFRHGLGEARGRGLGAYAVVPSSAYVPMPVYGFGGE